MYFKTLYLKADKRSNITMEILTVPMAFYEKPQQFLWRFMEILSFYGLLHRYMKADTNIDTSSS